MTWIAHRGAPGPDVTENTLPAFLAAAGSGAYGVELDVRGTRDGALAVFHDGVVGNRRVRTLTLEELREASGCDVPTLSDVLVALPDHVGLIIEVKDRGLEVRIATAVTTTRAAERLAWLRVASFHPGVLRRLRVLAPDVGRALCVWEGQAGRAANPIAAMTAAFARDLMIHHPLVTAKLVAAVRARGGEVWPWTVNTPEDAARVAACGVRTIITDVRSLPPSSGEGLGRGADHAS